MPTAHPADETDASAAPVLTAAEHQIVDPWAEGVAFLRALDVKWEAIIDQVGPCRLAIRPDRFGTLVRAIIGQQISSKAARSIDARVRSLAGEIHAPGALLKIGEEGLRSAGLSGVKARYVLNLSRAVADGDLAPDLMHDWADDEVARALTSVKGIGAWTAEMFLIFALGRADILSVGDLGIRVGLRSFYGLDALPTPQECRDLTEAWRPYRTVAMWYLWQQIDNPPKITADAKVVPAPAPEATPKPGAKPRPARSTRIIRSED